MRVKLCISIFSENGLKTLAQGQFQEFSTKYFGLKMGQMFYNASPICSIMRLQFVCVSEGVGDLCPFYRYIGAFCTGNRVVGNVLRISVHSLCNKRPQIVAWGRFWRILTKILVENGRHFIGFHW